MIWLSRYSECSQAFATHLKLVMYRHQIFRRVEVTWLELWHQDSSPSSQQGDLPNSDVNNEQSVCHRKLLVYRAVCITVLYIEFNGCLIPLYVHVSRTMWRPHAKNKNSQVPLEAQRRPIGYLGCSKWYTGCTNIAMRVMVDACIWTCSEQSHKGRRGGWLLKGCSNEAHRRVWRMNAQWSANGRHVINAFWSKPDPPIWVPPLYIHCASIGQPIAWIGRRHGHRSAFIWRPRQPLSHHGNCSSLHLPY